MFVVVFATLTALTADPEESQSRDVEEAPSVEDLELPSRSEVDATKDELRRVELVREGTKKGLLYGAGSDFEKVEKGLVGLDKAGMARVEAIYEDRFGTSMREDIGSEWASSLGLQSSKATAALLEGDTAAYNAVKRFETVYNVHHHLSLGRYKEAYSALAAISSSGELAEVRADLGRRMSGGKPFSISGSGFISIPETSTDQTYRESIDTLLVEGPETAHAELLSRFIDDRSIREVRELVESQRDNLPAIVEVYQAEFGDLDEDLSTEFSDSVDLEITRAVIEGDSIAEKAIALNEAMGWIADGSDEEAIFSTLSDMSSSERRHLEADYRARYGRELQVHLESELSGNDRALALTLLQKGELSEAEELYHAINTREMEASEVRGLLEGKTEAEVKRLARQYTKLDENSRGRSLEQDIKKRFNNRDELMLGEVMAGATATEEGRQALALQMARYDTEQEGIGKEIVDSLTSDDEVLERNADRLEAAISDPEAAEGRAGQLASYVEEDTENYVETRETAAETGATIVAAGAAVATTPLTGGGSTGLLLAGGVGSGAFVGTKASLQGDSYEVSGRDALLGAIEGTVAFKAAGFARRVSQRLIPPSRKSLTAQVGRETVEGTIDGSAGGFGVGVADRVLEGELENGPGAVLAGGFQDSLLGGLGGGVFGGTLSMPRVRRTDTSGVGSPSETPQARQVAGNIDGREMAFRVSSNQSKPTFYTDSETVEFLVNSAHRRAGDSVTDAAAASDEVVAFVYQGSDVPEVSQMFDELGIQPGSIISTDPTTLSPDARREMGPILRHENAHIEGYGEIEATRVQQVQTARMSGDEAAAEVVVPVEDLSVSARLGIHPAKRNNHAHVARQKDRGRPDDVRLADYASKERIKLDPEEVSRRQLPELYERILKKLVSSDDLRDSIDMLSDQLGLDSNERLLLGLKGVYAAKAFQELGLAETKVDFLVNNLSPSASSNFPSPGPAGSSSMVEFIDTLTELSEEGVEGVEKSIHGLANLTTGKGVNSERSLSGLSALQTELVTITEGIRNAQSPAEINDLEARAKIAAKEVANWGHSLQGLLNEPQIASTISSNGLEVSELSRRVDKGQFDTEIDIIAFRGPEELREELFVEVKTTVGAFLRKNSEWQAGEQDIVRRMSQVGQQTEYAVDQGGRMVVAFVENPLNSPSINQLRRFLLAYRELYPESEDIIYDASSDRFLDDIILKKSH